MPGFGTSDTERLVVTVGQQVWTISIHCPVWLADDIFWRCGDKRPLNQTLVCVYVGSFIVWVFQTVFGCGYV